MSIWCSLQGIGDGSEEERGTVLTYAEGFGNHYPDETGSHELPATVRLALVAPWCVPGGGDSQMKYVEEAGPWLRLSVGWRRRVCFWTCDGEPAGRHTHGSDATSVVLDEDAARALRDDLSEWLERDKVRPMEESA